MMSPNEIDSLADAVAERVAERLAGRPSNDALVDCHEAADLLGCSVPTIERLAKSGAIPSIKIGRLRRYRRADLVGRQNQKGGSDE